MCGIRFLFLFIVFGYSLCCSGGNQKDDQLGPLDPSKPMYQVKDGYPSIPITWPLTGGLRKCRLPDPVTMEGFKESLEREKLRHKQELQEKESELKFKQHQKEMTFGGWLKMAGWCLLVFAGIAHCATNVSIIKNYSTMMFLGGIGSISGGMAIQKTVEFDKIGTVVFLVFLVGAAMFFARKWSISRLPGISHAVSKVKTKMHEYRIKDE